MVAQPGDDAAKAGATPTATSSSSAAASPGCRSRCSSRAPTPATTSGDRRHRAPGASGAEAAHKVGESTVEIGAHYFADVLGVRRHLEREQLQKFGFRFFFSDRRDDIDQVTEIGASRFLPTGELPARPGHGSRTTSALQARAAGVRFVRRGTVRESVRLAEGRADHVVEIADGRRRAPQRSLPLAGRRVGSTPACSSVDWGWRSRTPTTPTPSGSGSVTGSTWTSWSDDPEWLARCHPPKRWLSTSHLCGARLLGLADPASLGRAFGRHRRRRDQLHPIDTMNTFETAMDWLARHQPRLHRELEAKSRPAAGLPVLARFSYDCKRVFDGHGRWALTGEAGLFLDPYYSPGSDYIAIATRTSAIWSRGTSAGEPVARPRRDLPARLLLALRNRR